MSSIGVNAYNGLFTETEMLRGKVPAPGTRQRVTINGDTKEFVAVKLASGVWINGTVINLDNGGTVGAAVTASGTPAAAIHQRVGVLVFASATSTLTMAATAVGWAQIYGQVKARTSAAIGTLLGQLGMGAGAGALIAAVVQASASAALTGITALATVSATAQSANGVNLLSVFLTYPRYSGLPDANLA
jgi:hypothetical protein